MCRLYLGLKELQPGLSLWLIFSLSRVLLVSKFSYVRWPGGNESMFTSYSRPGYLSICVVPWPTTIVRSGRSYFLVIVRDLPCVSVGHSVTYSNSWPVGFYVVFKAVDELIDPWYSCTDFLSGMECWVPESFGWSRSRHGFTARTYNTTN